jgi:VanZ family protein
MTSRLSDSDWTDAVGLTLVLLVASLVPSPLERHADWEWVGPDKFLHLVGHAAYAVVLADALDMGRYSRPQAAALAVCLSTGHSLVTGRLQAYVPGRAFERGDVVASFVGSVLAASGWYVRGRARPDSPDVSQPDAAVIEGWSWLRR